MKTIQMKIRFIILLFLLIGTVQNSVAQELQYAGIPSEKFNYFVSSQHNSNWCWAASIQMIFNYYGVDITQEQIVARTYGTDPYGNLPNWTGSFDVITSNLNNWNMDNSGRQYQVAAVLYPGAPKPLYLIQELTEQRPVMIGYKTGPQSGHAVVITAVSYIDTEYGPYIQSIIVRDPFPTEENIATKGRVEHKAEDLANRIDAHWYIRVQ